MVLVFEKAEQLWSSVIQYGWHVRRSHADGLQKWNDLKKLLDSVVAHDLQWSAQCLEFFDVLVSMGLMESSAGLSQESWEKHHFFLQLGRIPHRNRDSFSTMRLFQVAYNVGQLRVELELQRNRAEAEAMVEGEVAGCGDEIYSSQLLSYYADHQLDSIRCYTGMEALALVELAIPDWLAGRVDALTLDLSLTPQPR